MRLHDRFEWDAAKARTNLRKHGVSLDDAQAVLSDGQGDLFHVEEYDDANSVDEDRYVTTGSDPFERSRVLVIAWTERSDEQGRLTRIISARAATPSERKDYARQIGQGG